MNLRMKLYSNDGRKKKLIGNCCCHIIEKELSKEIEKYTKKND